MQMGNIAVSQATGVVTRAQRQRAWLTEFEPASEPDARGCKCPTPVCCWYLQTAGMTLPAEIQALRR